MFKLIALFALVAVSAAEPEADPQWVGSYLTPHLKTASGDTLSVAAAKNQHHQLKAHAYTQNAYVYNPYVYNTGYVAAPYSQYAYNPYVYNTGYPAASYSHLLYKREAESDPAVGYSYRTSYHGYPSFYNTGVSSVYPQMYNTGVYSSAYPQTYNTGYLAAQHSQLAYSPYVYNNGYAASSYAHRLYKREAESDPAVLYNYRSSYRYPFYNTGVSSAYPQMYNTGRYTTLLPSSYIPRYNWYNRNNWNNDYNWSLY